VGDVVEPLELSEPAPFNPLEVAWPPTTKAGSLGVPDGVLAALDGVVTLFEPDIEPFWRFPSTRGEPFET
jgi:hypothetical protein